ncbi:MAG: hypothetical protein K2I53_02080, partial [Lachnospiraceae bacterium]|nr:hypothetical protein [Lachnospiraceae bacterium]
MSAAMILTGSAVSGMTAYAAQPDVENEGGGLKDDVDDSKDTVQNPDTGNDPVTDVEDGAGSDDSEQKDSDDQKQPEDDTTLPGDGGNDDSSDEEDDGNGGLEDPDDGDEDLKDPDAEDQEEEEGNKSVIEKDDGSLMSAQSARDECGTLVNGDFSEWDGTVPKAWKLTPEYDGKDNFKVQTIDDAHGEYKTLYIYKEEETEISVSQIIPNMKPGAYLLTLDAGGVYGKDQITLKVETVEQTDENDEEYSDVSAVLATESLGECDAWGKWNTIATEAFKVEVPSGKAEVNVKITISGKIGVGGSAEQFYLDDVEFISYTLSDLNILLTEAANKQEADYTAETWSAFAEKKSAAQSLVDGGATDETKALEIMQAYIALKEAMDALQSSSTDVDVTFYYYAGETEDEIGLYYWGDNISTTAQEAGWNAYSGDKAYLFTAVDGYAGWYSIPIQISSDGDGSGFEIFVESDTGTPKVKYSASENSDIYGKLADGTNQTCAYKNGINYSGTDEATGLDKAAAIMRNVTFYVYSEEVVPAIQLDNNSAATELAVVNEEDGSITKLTPSGQDNDGNNVYELQPVADKGNWYFLAFSAPGPIDLDNSKIGGFYGKIDGNYTWLKDLKNGNNGDTWGVGFAPVFADEKYCKYEHGTTDDAKKLSFYASMEEAEAVALGQLNALLASDELKKITDKGETGYTEAAWAGFSTALAAAKKAASDNSTQPDTFTSD